MSEPSPDSKSDPVSEPTAPPNAELTERLFKKGKVSTVTSVDLVATQFGVGSIPLLLQALNASSPKTREAAFEALRGLGEPAFQQLLKAAIEAKGDQRLAAVTYLGEWGDPRAVDALILAIRRDRGDQTRKNVGQVVGHILLVTLVGGILILLAALLQFDCTGCGGCGDAGCFACETADDIRLRLQATKSLVRLGDLRAVSALARLVQDKDLNVAKAAHEALMELLQKGDSLQEGQAAALGPDGLTELAALLSKNDYRMSRAILAVFRQVGDGRILSAVEKLAQDYSRSRDLREEAQRLLLLLKERIARQESRTTLLRAADGDHAASSKNLLRPATGQSATEPPEQLLRAKDAD